MSTFGTVGSALVLVWVHLGRLGQPWFQSEYIFDGWFSLGSSMSTFGTALVPVWEHLGRLVQPWFQYVCIWDSWVSLGWSISTFGTVGSALVPVWVHLGRLVQPKLVPVWVHLGRLVQPKLIQYEYIWDGWFTQSTSRGTTGKVGSLLWVLLGWYLQTWALWKVGSDLFPAQIQFYGRSSLLVGCLTSQQHAMVSQGRICSDKFTCCHTEIEVADQTFQFTQSQYTDRVDQSQHWPYNARRLAG